MIWHVWAAQAKQSFSACSERFCKFQFSMFLCFLHFLWLYLLIHSFIHYILSLWVYILHIYFFLVDSHVAKQHILHLNCISCFISLQCFSVFAQVLEALPGPVCPVAFVGDGRSGKSYLASKVAPGLAEDPWHPQCPMAFLMTSIEFQDALGCFGTPDSNSKLWKKWLAAISSTGVCVWCILLVSCTLRIWCLGRFWGGRRCIQRRWLRRSRDRRQHVRV